MAQIPMTTATPQQESFDGAKKDFPVIPDDTVVNVEVVSVELRDFPEEFRRKYDVKDKQEVSFRFRITDGDFKGQNLWGSARPVFDDSDQCRLRLWTQEILGVDKLPDGYVFDTDDFADATCRVLVSERRRKSDGKFVNRVKDVLRATRTTPGAMVPNYEDEPF